ncbi:hypothetical protein OXH18_04505 [Thermocoleostomius sinensis A174]|uniref:Uncharacterized protein n=1 Tax=Thermocoleostomius sinensis A174 TaxID=2016057 RepID=A0A9E8ZEC6_9CYAN|nr:hypothetical protein OXH18_04505 [Thermocoleostomius sinensis A174]
MTWLRRSIVTGFAGLSFLMTDAIFSPVQATQQLFCTGRMTNGWAYTAEFLDGRFTQIRWERSGQPPQVSQLTFASTNALGQPIYRGSLMAAVAVTLVDLSAGDVRPSSEISVGVEEWGWSRGTCGLSSTGPGGGTGSSGSVAALRQDLLGVDATRAREWLRQNDFFFTQTIEQTTTRVVEQWHRDTDRAIVQVIFNNSVVSDVVQMR